MSEQLAAAAAALNAPEELVERSARARASAQGVSYEEIIAAWAGGEAPPAAAAQPAAVSQQPAPAADEADEAPAVEEQPAAEVAAAPAAPAAAPAPAAVAVVAAPNRDAAPLLTGKRESMAGLMVGILGLLAAAVLFMVLIPTNTTGDDRHIVGEAFLSGEASEGRDIYLEQGCQYCHTQNVRAVVADAGLGPVTETGARALDDPAAFGVQRIGPDLAHVAIRLPVDVDPAEYLTEYLTHPAEVVEGSRQPPYAHLSDDDMAALVAYVLALR